MFDLGLVWQSLPGKMYTHVYLLITEREVVAGQRNDYASVCLSDLMSFLLAFQTGFIRNGDDHLQKRQPWAIFNSLVISSLQFSYPASLAQHLCTPT